jgi:hypothetical protein
VDVIDDDRFSDVVETLALMGHTPLLTVIKSVVILMNTEKP